MSSFDQAFGKLEHAFFILGGNNGIIRRFCVAGITITLKPFATFLPSNILAAHLKSSIRPLVHEPITT